MAGTRAECTAAVMKVGQRMPMDGQGVRPPEFAARLAGQAQSRQLASRSAQDQIRHLVRELMRFLTSVHTNCVFDAATGRMALRDFGATARVCARCGVALRHAGPFDFGASDLFSRSCERGRAKCFNEGFARTPPPDMLLLQRKFVGTLMRGTWAAGEGKSGGGFR